MEGKVKVFPILLIVHVCFVFFVWARGIWLWLFASLLLGQAWFINTQESCLYYHIVWCQREGGYAVRALGGTRLRYPAREAGREGEIRCVHDIHAEG